MDQPQTALIDEIDEFTARVGMSPITFGRKAMGDPHFVRQLREGRRLWPETEARAREFIAKYRTPTPKPGVPFPARSGGTTEVAAL